MRDALEAASRLLALEVEETKKGLRRSLVTTLVVSLFCATSYIFLTFGAYLALRQSLPPSIAALFLASANMFLAGLAILVCYGLKKREKTRKSEQVKHIIQSLSPRSYAFAVFATALLDRKSRKR